jgi:YHS domain-containing protein
MLLRTILIALLFPGWLVAGEKNEKCPLMTGDDIDEEQLVEYEGIKVYFCCQHCRKLFNAGPKYIIKASLELLPQFEEIKDRLKLDEVQLLPQRFCPIQQKYIVTPASPSVSYRGHTIYLWDDEALKTWNADPDGCAKRAVEAGLLPQLGK